VTFRGAGNDVGTFRTLAVTANSYVNTLPPDDCAPDGIRSEGRGSASACPHAEIGPQSPLSSTLHIRNAARTGILPQTEKGTHMDHKPQAYKTKSSKEPRTGFEKMQMGHARTSKEIQRIHLEEAKRKETGKPHHAEGSHHR
jgi:hypothetical protein